MFEYTRAFIIMLRAHYGQKDKGGNFYFLHPLRVSMDVKSKSSKIVALLHDTLEDSNKYTIDDFTFLDDEQSAALLLLSHKESDDYFEYIDKIKSNKIAREVKMSDLKDNMNLKRIANPTAKDFRRIEKYKMAMKKLKSDYRH